MPEQQGRGHRADAPRHWAQRARDPGHRRVHVACQPPVSRGVGADVDHRGPSRDVPRRDQPGPPRRHHENFRLPGYRGQVRSPRMADGDRGVAGDQQLRHRLAHHRRTAHHHRPAPAQRHPVVIEQRQYRRGGGRREGRQAGHQPAERDRVGAVHVLGRVDERGEFGQPRAARQRGLQQDPVHRRVAAQRGQGFPDPGQGGLLGFRSIWLVRDQISDVAGDAGLDRSPGQRPDVPGAGLVRGGHHHRQPRRQARRR